MIEAGTRDEFKRCVLDVWTIRCLNCSRVYVSVKEKIDDAVLICCKECNPSGENVHGYRNGRFGR